MKHNLRIVALALLPLLLMSGTAMAAETPELELTLKEAVERALAVSFPVKKASLERDKALLEKQEASEKLRDFYVTFSPEVEEAHILAAQAEINYHIKSKLEEAEKRDFTTTVVEKYINALIAQEKAAAAGKSLSLTQYQHDAAQISFSHGMISLSALQKAKNNLEEAEDVLSSAQQELNKAYTDFNILVGLGAESRPNLVSEIPYIPLDINNITAEINRALDTSPDLWAAERFISLKRLDLLRYFVPSYDVAELELELAELDARGMREEIKRKLLLLIDEILSVEKAVAAAEVQVKKAEEALKEAVKLQSAGLLTKGEVLQLEVALDSARAALDELQYRHAILMTAYRNLTGREILPPSLTEAADDGLD